MSPAKISTVSPELSPVWVTAQYNGLCEFSAFTLATLFCFFFFLTVLSALLLECCLLYPHLITLCGAAGIIGLSQVLFASAVQWFCSILLSQLANALSSVLLYCVLLFRIQVQLSQKETPLSLNGELVFCGKNRKKNSRALACILEGNI